MVLEGADVAEAFTNLLTQVHRSTWTRDAACRGEHALFFAPFAERPETRRRRESRARAICVRCPVVVACREWARSAGEHGFWGAESEEERSAAGFHVAAPVGRLRLMSGG
jgi:hypothetical protein